MTKVLKMSCYTVVLNVLSPSQVAVLATAAGSLIGWPFSAVLGWVLMLM